MVQLVHGPEASAALVRDGRVKAIAFTGSARDGRNLHDLAKARPEPIPFYGESGGLDLLFVTPGAAKARLAEIAEGAAFAKPGLVLAPAGAGLPEAMAEHFADTAHLMVGPVSSSASPMSSWRNASARRSSSWSMAARTTWVRLRRRPRNPYGHAAQRA